MCVMEGKTYIHYFSKYEYYNLMLNWDVQIWSFIALGPASFLNYDQSLFLCPNTVQAANTNQDRAQIIYLQVFEIF